MSPSSALSSTDAVESQPSSPALDDVETIARPIAAQPTDMALNFQTPDAIAEGAETEQRFLGGVREGALTRGRVATPPGATSEETSAFTVGEERTGHTAVEQRPSVNEAGAITEHESVIAERESAAEQETLIAERERGAPKRRSDLTVIGEPARAQSSVAEFEPVDQGTETAELSASRAELAIHERSASESRSDLLSSPTVGRHGDEAAEPTDNVKTTSPRGREAVVSRPIARRGEDASQPPNASESTNAWQLTVEGSALSAPSRTDASFPAVVSAEDVGPEPVTGARAVSRPPRTVDSRPATQRDETLERPVNASSPQLLRDGVSRTLPREEDAPPSTTAVGSPTIEVKAASPLRATIDSPAIGRQRDERPQPVTNPEPATNSQPTSRPSQDVLSSRTTAVVNPPTSATPETTRLAANDSSSSSNKGQQRASSTLPSVSEAIDQRPAREKKQTPDARSLQNRTPPRRDRSPISQSTLMAADRPLGASRNSPEPREKIIRVTIGRIEVHAAPPPPPPVEPPAPALPKLSLDEFLRQPNGGRK
jgi:hypothetical protein